MTAKEKEAIVQLFNEIETVTSWLDDSAYPKKARRDWDEAVEKMKAAIQGKSAHKLLELLGAA